MKLYSLYLRHFKGLLAGVGLPEVTLDFQSLPESGLIAVVGDNGMGKTTILDNCHPYRLMPYKLRKSDGWSPAAFSFYDQCIGQDARKELVFSMGGVLYKSVLLIDADRRKQEAYLYRDTAGTGAWEPLNDGKTRTYDEKVEAVCGSPSLFFTSVFRSQGARNLSDYTRGDIMAVVAELLNIEHIREQGEKARKVAGLFLAEVDVLSGKRQSLAVAAQKRDELMLARREATEAADAVERQQAGLRSELAGLQQELRDLEIANAAEATTLERIADREAEVGRVEQTIRDLFEAQAQRITEVRAEIEAVSEQLRLGTERAEREHRAFVARRVEAEKLLEREAEIREAAASLPGGKLAIEEATTRLQSLRDEFSGVRTQLAELSTLPTQVADASRNLDSLLVRTNALAGLDCRADGSAWVNEACPLLKDAVSAKGLVDGARETLAALTAKVPVRDALRESESLLKKNGEELAALVKTLEARLAEVSEVAALRPALDAAKTRIAEIDADAESAKAQWEEQAGVLSDRIVDLENKRAEIAGSEDARVAELRASVAASKAVIENLRAGIGGGFAARVAEVQRKVRFVETTIAEAEALSLRVQSELGRLAAQLDSIEEAEAELSRLDEEIAGIHANVADWTLLAKACGNDGICALEIDDAGPSIAAIANDLLKTCYGPRYSVRLETQSAKVNGEMKEDFDISVFDAESGEQRSITEMSGGQVCWIEDALTRAICLFNIDRSDRVFGTLYSDEKDGALDASRKHEFMAVKRRSLALGSHSRELFISQTPELIALADGVIRLSPGKVEVSS